MNPILLKANLGHIPTSIYIYRTYILQLIFTAKPLTSLTVFQSETFKLMDKSVLMSMTHLFLNPFQNFLHSPQLQKKKKKKLL